METTDNPEPNHEPNPEPNLGTSVSPDQKNKIS